MRTLTAVLAAAGLVAAGLIAVSPASAAPSEVRLDRAGWTLTASSEGFGYPPRHALDGSISTLWSSGNGQTPGQFLRLDTGGVVEFDAIDLATGSAVHDYARQYSVTTSLDGISWSAPITGTGSAADGTMRISLGVATDARYVRIEQTSGHFINAWSVAELNLVLGDVSGYSPQAAVRSSTAAPNSNVLIDVWGLVAGEPVTARASGGAPETSGTADAAGRVLLSLPAPAAEGEFSFTVTGAWTGWTTTLEVLVTTDPTTTDPDPNPDDACETGAEGDPVVSLSSPQATAGSSLTVAGSGFDTGTYRIEIRSAGTPADAVSVDGWFECTDGAFDRVVTVPVGVAAGSYIVAVVSETSVIATAALTITAANATTVDRVAIDEAGGTVSLSWSASPGASGYEVQRASGRFSTFTAVGTVAAPEFDDAVGSDKFDYYYRVVTIAGDNRSAPSAPVSLETELFGENFTIFSPTDATAEVNALTARVATEMIPRTQEFSEQRYAFAFKPGAYATNRIDVGYYTSVYGLGETPRDTTVPRVEVSSWGADSLTNFWRSIENIGIDTGSPSSEVKWAASQAAPARRLWVNGKLHLDDIGKPASGGFLADSVVTGQTGSWSQQQYFLRNSDLGGGWYNGVWNVMFLGTTGAPAESDDWANTGYNSFTVETNTPVVREKPFLYLTDAGDYEVFVPGLRQQSAGVSWSAGDPGTGRSIPISQFHVAKPEVDTAQTLNAALDAGKNLLFTPGIYEIDETLRVDRADTVVLGLGLATLRPTSGDDAVHVADVDGVTLAGLLFDASPAGSEALLKVGDDNATADHSGNPTLLADVFTRVGGAVDGKAETSVVINSDDVIADHFWLWRADHGTGADSTGWTKNTGDHGLVVNGDDVNAYGLFVEHFQNYQTLWNGDRGATYFYQSELPYDPPTQADYMSHGGTVKGYSSYKVTDEATSHYAVGLGIYDVFVHTDEFVATENAMEVSSGTKVRHAAIVSLGAGGGQHHVVNGVGGGVTGGEAKKVGVNLYEAKTPLGVAAVASARCVSAKAVVTLALTNTNDVPVSLQVNTAYGSKLISEQAPGARSSHTFTTRQRSIPSSTATVIVSGVVRGAPVSMEVPVPVPAHTC